MDKPEIFLAYSNGEILPNPNSPEAEIKKPATVHPESLDDDLVRKLIAFGEQCGMTNLDAISAIQEGRADAMAKYGESATGFEGAAAVSGIFNALVEIQIAPTKQIDNPKLNHPSCFNESYPRHAEEEVDFKASLYSLDITPKEKEILAILSGVRDFFGTPDIATVSETFGVTIKQIRDLFRKVADELGIDDSEYLRPIK